MQDYPPELTLAQARKNRADLEAEMTEMLNQFVLKHGLTVDGISLMPNHMLGQYRYLVKLDVKI